jgi:hypothetical protein
MLFILPLFMCFTWFIILASTIPSIYNCIKQVTTVVILVNRNSVFIPTPNTKFSLIEKFASSTWFVSSTFSYDFLFFFPSDISYIHVKSDKQILHYCVIV